MFVTQVQGHPGLPSEFQANPISKSETNRQGLVSLIFQLIFKSQLFIISKTKNIKLDWGL